NMTSTIRYKAGDSDKRPWGEWHVIHVGENHVVKIITINPGQASSLQYHNHRNENWIILTGQALITIGDQNLTKNVGESAFIPAGVHHRIANVSDAVMQFIEIQTGPQLDENDIIRLE